eukprot:3298271-Amphidinium_carterae.1
MEVFALRGLWPAIRQHDRVPVLQHHYADDTSPARAAPEAGLLPYLLRNAIAAYSHKQKEHQT